MQYIKVKFINGVVETFGYQEVCRGNVIGYKDLDGNIISQGGITVVVDDNPPFPSWGIVADLPLPPDTQDQIYNKLIHNGYLDQQTGFKLKTDLESQSLFTNYTTLLQMGVDYNSVPLSQIIDFDDYDNNVKYLTIQDFFALMFRYGMYCKTIFDQKP